MLTKAILLAVLVIESGGNHLAISPTGARGLMQLTSVGAKEVCQQYGCDPDFDLFDPETNMRMGTQLLQFYLEEANGDPIGMACLYNGGYAAYNKYRRGEPLPAETEAYVHKFKQLRKYYGSLLYRIPEEIPAHFGLVDRALDDTGVNLFDGSLLIGPSYLGISG